MMMIFGAGIHWMEPRDLCFADMDFTIGSPQGLSSKVGEQHGQRPKSARVFFETQPGPEHAMERNGRGVRT
jgi:hypothetical protein